MIIYASRTGNTHYITSKLKDIECLNVDTISNVDKPFIVFTYTDGLGDVPKKVETFMKEYGYLCKGVICTGNSNFGNEIFCKAGDILSNQYNIPLILKIELRGFNKDYEYIIEQYNKIMKEGS